jgi:WD40 repeat protein
MVGHAHQVSSLDVNAEDGWIVSGSWDGTAKLWRIGQWEPAVEFPGHQGTVWAVVAYSKEIVVTGGFCHPSTEAETDQIQDVLTKAFVSSILEPS